MDLKSLYRDYNLEIGNKEVSLFIKEKKKAVEQNFPESAISVSDAWPADFLPKSEYMIKETEKNLEKIENLSNFNIEKLSSKNFVKISTKLDLFLVKQVTAEHLIEYKGSATCNAISHIINKNRFSQTLIARRFDQGRIFRMLKYAAEYKNYNMIHVLVKCLQSKRLKRRRFEKMMLYRNLLEQQEGGIFPFDWMLKDCEDSNLNAESEVASLRFCKIIEKLKEMKSLELDYLVSAKSVHIFYNSLWKEAKTQISEIEEKQQESVHYFLIL